MKFYLFQSYSIGISEKLQKQESSKGIYAGKKIERHTTMTESSQNPKTY